MNCTAFEAALAQYAEDTLPAGERARVAAHLTDCRACRETLEQLGSLDAALSRELGRPALSAGFAARLWERIARETPLVTAANAVGERKRLLRAEYDAGLRRLQPRSSWWTAVLDGLGFGVLVGGFAYAFVQYAPEIIRASFGSTEALARALAGTLAAGVLGLAVAWSLGWKTGGRWGRSLFRN
jgi:anti-sigma factor RsiW